MKVAVDARMYNMSGIGTYIQNLMKNDCYQIALGSTEELKDVKNVDTKLEFEAPIYGIKEQFASEQEIVNYCIKECKKITTP